jgi:hypothetical protein
MFAGLLLRFIDFWFQKGLSCTLSQQAISDSGGAGFTGVIPTNPSVGRSASTSWHNQEHWIASLPPFGSTADSFATVSRY